MPTTFCIAPLAANDFSKKELAATLAPSMDIVVSSNFERLLFDAYDRDGAAVAALLERFQQEPTALGRCTAGQAARKIRQP